jgi:hypothetical protein
MLIAIDSNLGERGMGLVLQQQGESGIGIGLGIDIDIGTLNWEAVAKEHASALEPDNESLEGEGIPRHSGTEQSFAYMSAFSRI